MTTKEYLTFFRQEIHAVAACTIGSDGKANARIIPLVRSDSTLYFLAARGDPFYQELKEQKFVALSGTRRGISISLRGAVRSMGRTYLDEIFADNPELSRLYPAGRRDALEVFQLYTGEGEYVDGSDPGCIHRVPFALGGGMVHPQGFRITDRCEGCRTCVGVCPQDAIDFMVKPFSIRQERCLHCGSCQVSCPYRAIEKL